MITKIVGKKAVFFGDFLSTLLALTRSIADIMESGACRPHNFLLSFYFHKKKAPAKWFDKETFSSHKMTK
jgi:hypothetical protein